MIVPASWRFPESLPWIPKKSLSIARSDSERNLFFLLLFEELPNPAENFFLPVNGRLIKRNRLPPGGWYSDGVERHRLLPVADHVRGERGLLASHTNPLGAEGDPAWSLGADTCCAEPSQRAPLWLGRAEPPGLRRVPRRPLRRRLIAAYGSVHWLISSSCFWCV